MRVVIQRVLSARVSFAGKKYAEIGPGLLVFVGVAEGDTEADGKWLTKKIAGLRVFPPEGQVGLVERMNRSVREVAGEVLVISQFSLMASLAKGNRPSFRPAAKPEESIPLYEAFLRQLEAALGRKPASGRFGEMMQVDAANHGPVTLILDSRARG
jgi:D-tyrosyl-tRNA(Tyr) deacylase